MLKQVKVTNTDFVLGADAVCVLYAQVTYVNEAGILTECPTPISGIFEVCNLELPPRKNENEHLSVYVWCFVNDIQPFNFDDGYWLILKVSPHGLIELPDYCGEVIDRIDVT